MTQYATSEKRYKCMNCEISCTRREMNQDHVIALKCPNCDNPIVYRCEKVSVVGHDSTIFVWT